jgi:probable HAF family extracellular repeat protein
MNSHIAALARSLVGLALTGLAITPNATLAGEGAADQSGYASATSGGPGGDRGSLHLRRHHAMPRREKSPHDDDPNGLPTFTRSFEWRDQKYTARFVGSDPSGREKTTTITNLIVPLRLDFGNGIVVDADHDLVDGRTVLDDVLNSPLYRNAPFSCGPISMGNTQYGDAFMRANFWSEAKNKPGYHTLLHPVVAATQTLVVPADKAYFPADNAWLGVDYNWLDAQLVAVLQTVGATPNENVVFLAGHEVGFFDSSFDFPGYHSATPYPAQPNVPTQSYIVLGSFSASNPDWGAYGVNHASATLAHETLEWFNDPFVNNDVPPWEMYGPTFWTNDILETCDYFDFLPTLTAWVPIAVEGQSYWVEDGAFFDFFTRAATSRSANGWYSFFNNAKTYSLSTPDDNDKFTETDIDYPGALRTFATGINNQGDIVGYCRDASNARHGFLCSGGIFQVVDVPGASASYPLGINDAGQVSGYYLDGTGAHGFTLINGHYTTINFAAGDTYLFKINNRGQVAGGFSDGSSPGVAFVFDHGKYRPEAPDFAFEATAFGINDHGIVVGGYDTGNPDDNFGFIGNGSKFRRLDFPGSGVAATYLEGINNRGHVAGYLFDSAGYVTGFYKQDDTWLHVLYGGYATYLNGLNDRGDAVGFYYDFTVRKYRGLLLSPIKRQN